MYKGMLLYGGRGARRGVNMPSLLRKDRGSYKKGSTGRPGGLVG